MRETLRIEDQLSRAFRGDAWHGPSLQYLLQDIPFDQAASHPIAGAHSIWEIVLHLTAWEHAVALRLQGEPLELAPEEDWPPLSDCTEAGWRIALGNLAGAHEKLRGAIAALDPARLDERVPGKSYSVYFMLHGAVQHNLYHAGQIALLKKA